MPFANPPAFPRTAAAALEYEALGLSEAAAQEGMSLLDYFAAAALTGLLAGDNYDHANLAADAYSIGREMVKERFRVMWEDTKPAPDDEE